MSYVILDANSVHKACIEAEKQELVSEEDDGRLQAIKALAVVAMIDGLGDGTIAISGEDIVLLGQFT